MPTCLMSVLQAGAVVMPVETGGERTVDLRRALIVAVSKELDHFVEAVLVFRYKMRLVFVRGC